MEVYVDATMSPDRALAWESIGLYCPKSCPFLVQRVSLGPTLTSFAWNRAMRRGKAWTRPLHPLTPARSAGSRRNSWAGRTRCSASSRWRLLQHSWLSQFPRLSRTCRERPPHTPMRTECRLATRAANRATTITTARCTAAAIVQANIRTNTFKTATRQKGTALTGIRETPHPLRLHRLPHRRRHLRLLLRPTRLRPRPRPRRHPHQRRRQRPRRRRHPHPHQRRRQRPRRHRRPRRHPRRRPRLGRHPRRRHHHLRRRRLRLRRHRLRRHRHPRRRLVLRQRLLPPPRRRRHLRRPLRRHQRRPLRRHQRRPLRRHQRQRRRRRPRRPRRLHGDLLLHRRQHPGRAGLPLLPRGRAWGGTRPRPLLRLLLRLRRRHPRRHRQQLLLQHRPRPAHRLQRLPLRRPRRQRLHTPQHRPQHRPRPAHRLQRLPLRLPQRPRRPPGRRPRQLRRRCLSPRRRPLPGQGRDSSRALELPSVPVIGEAATRVRNTLTGVINAPRQRTTLIVILILTGILALGAFAYLVFRRR